MVPKRDPTKSSIIEPTASTVNVVVARSRTLWIICERKGVFTIQVLTPFPYISAHIIDSQTIWVLDAHIVAASVTICCAPCHIFDFVTSSIFGPTSLSTSGCIFPLSLGWQAEILTRLCVQTGDESLAIVPGHTLHRKLSALEIGWVIPHHSLPQRLSD